MALLALSLCSGVGGLDLGVRLALGDYVRTVCYVEREAFAASVLVARMEDASLDPAPIWDDLSTFDGAAFRGGVDLVTAGYPCQPFSVAGRGLAERDPRHLWPHVLRVVQECEAPFLFCENVPGHWARGFERVVADLDRAGFRVAAGAFSAEEVGAPHRRERLFFLATHAERAVVRVESGRGGGSDGTGAFVTRVDGEAGPLADPDRGGLKGERRGRLPDGLLETGRSSQRNDANGRARAIVADPERQGLALGRVEPDRDELETAERSGGGWRFDEAPEPCVRGVDDGMADRVDRLRAGGNGVVPLVAAKAFLCLARELGLT